MHDVLTCLWFDTEAEEAARFYADAIDDAAVLEVTRVPDATAGEPGQVLTVTFEILGQRFVALNGGPQHRLTEAVSIQLVCDTQDEVDRLWSALTADGGQESMCGWLKDRFGMSWQVVPARLLDLLGSSNRELAARVAQAMLTMRRLDLAALEAAATGSA